MKLLRGLEWPTLAMLVATYLVWGIGTTIWQSSWVLSLLLTSLAIAQFSSLQHEVLHGHPFKSQRLNEALVFAGLTVYIPYLRFKQTHLTHHFDPNLTDPYDDPESNYLEPSVWQTTPGWAKLVLRANNTLAGRMLLGPAISIYYFVRMDRAAIRGGDTVVRDAWLLHAVGVAMVLIWLVAVGSMPVWANLVAAYIGFSLLKIRTYLEHRAHDACRARSVVVEDRGWLSYLFLNNNFHGVHHSHPGLAWYKLPQVYAEKRDFYLLRNEGYVYKSYAQIFRQYFFKAKDPVPHPMFPVKKSQTVE